MSKYNYNQALFYKETPELLYWLGFIAADGCVKEDRYSSYLAIGLSSKDEKHLEKWKQAIDFTGKVEKSNRNGYGGVRITITIDEEIKDILKTYNIVPRKSLIYRFPKNLYNHKWVNHFMRGYFDGDGGFTVAKQKGKKKQKTLYWRQRNKAVSNAIQQNTN